MPKIVGKSARVVETDHLSIDELAGNVASQEDRISIALVKVGAPSSEPWLTLSYDEWMCVTKGRMVIHYGSGETLEVVAGETVFIKSGERFQPTFPEGGTEYIPVCLPAFRPDRCAREDDPDSAVSVKLRSLHGGSAEAKRRKLAARSGDGPEVLYHMCQKSQWEAAKAAGQAYFPATFDADGFTHATAVPTRLLATANHFYKDSPGDWVCLRFRRSALRKLGIVTRDEPPMAVGTKASNEQWGDWVCPHVYGGLPPSVVDAEFPITRSGGEFTVIKGVTDIPDRVFKLATTAEVSKFRKEGRICSTLDSKDGFVHLSDRNSPPEVARLFFKACTDLVLLEVDPAQFAGPVQWVVNTVENWKPDATSRERAATTVHYLNAKGCVHHFSADGLPTAAIVREEAVPLGPDGAHVFPAWL